MNNPTDINEYRKRLASEDELKAGFVDSKGVLWNRYLVDYMDDNQKTMGVEIWATSFEDAQDRIQAVGANGYVVGVLLEEIPYE